ncbi:MAG TPA: metallophosphoesterase [candidate division Zixibacteria bacterium]|nr:metallophosphoesterase [candidate division Zixibacteria bacterium]
MIFLSSLALIDWYVFQGVKTLTARPSGLLTRRVIHFGYWGLTFVFFAGIASVLLKSGGRFRMMVLLFIFFLFSYLPKLAFALFLAVEDLYRIFRSGFVFFAHRFANLKPGARPEIFETRRRFISQMGLLAASVPFASVLYGVTEGKYNFRVRKQTLYFDDLPEAFDGFTITQVSDLHVGSFGDKSAVQKGVDLIRAQESDLLVFTGDLVNNQAAEMEGWLKIFGGFEAPYGKFSITGNHDYGDYVDWSSPEEKEKNFAGLKAIQNELGFRLLLNENAEIAKGEDRIALLGSENWGRPPFRQYGNLKKTVEGVESGAFKILLSHDPSHWDGEVLNFPVRIPLTLSGHTHGMQFGIEIPGWKWSPVKYRYPRWAGLYQEGNQYLYVNRGFGFLGFPGRVGIWPEVTVITLRKGKPLVAATGS